MPGGQHEGRGQLQIRPHWERDACRAGRSPAAATPNSSGSRAIGGTVPEPPVPELRARSSGNPTRLQGIQGRGSPKQGPLPAARSPPPRPRIPGSSPGTRRFPPRPDPHLPPPFYLRWAVGRAAPRCSWAGLGGARRILRRSGSARLRAPRAPRQRRGRAPAPGLRLRLRPAPHRAAQAPLSRRAGHLPQPPPPPRPPPAPNPPNPPAPPAPGPGDKWRGGRAGFKGREPAVWSPECREDAAVEPRPLSATVGALLPSHPWARRGVGAQPHRWLWLCKTASAFSCTRP